MGWGLSSWYGLARCLQILASLAASVLQAVLLAYITINRLGPGQSLPVLQGMMTSSLLFSTLALTLIRTGRRGQKTPWLVTAILGDLVFIGILLAELTILSQAGLPANCAGLTRSNYLPEDSREAPKTGYSSIRFSNQFGGSKGELDRYCALSRGFFIIVVGLVFAFIGSIIVEVLMVVAGSYTRNAAVELQIQAAVRDADKARSKPTSLASIGGGGGHHQHSHAQQQQHNIVPVAAAAAPVAAGPSTEAAFNPHTHPHPHVAAVHRHDSSSAHTLPSPVSPVSPSTHPYRYGPPPAAAAAAGYNHHHHYNNQAAAASSSSSSPPPVRTAAANFGYETPEEEAAAAALITDGSSRPDDAAAGHHHPGMPPRYTPGTLYPMSGHADETNEMRLSDYVKGETRAQNMKDGFR
ncbi:hypothetical protein GGTG_00801 [Gaeumannomyces tritici R3-111a-1]|uniref:Uncharacterized protein n=1 Tax=Gaeumannomyces tritici (strain R3-111a-1) TaxID=644352 RepID=J3NHR4_GAET3|nr:hypothetical protein GGTG_00801 [Gaeumannomyces tritici R3-111a-1]EJT80807.1 hypothetical protein GGTG_00801 [Gaeumannomyces tritici R3-111a-1]